MIFDSNFECGNLEKAIYKNDNEYDLYINSDTNSINRTQWFYFFTENTKKNQTVKFNILNLSKYPTFVKDGMNPILFSEKDYENIYLSWTTNRIENVNVYKSTIKNNSIRNIQISGNESENKKSNCSQIYGLSFTHTFKYDNDRVYFALYKPYSLTRMQNFLSQTENSMAKFPNPSIIYKRERICMSLSGIPIDNIIITSQDDLIQKTYIIITARAHAAETAGSYKVQGIIRFLLSQNPIAISLRQHHIFLIVPMLNPDGVLYGNNRCSLAGNDMNRCWNNPSKKFEPCIYKLKSKLANIYKGDTQILIYCDLHGHSRLYNSFIYACHKGTIGTLCSWTKVRLLPRIIARRCHLLNYHQCSFKVEPNKSNTARVIIWKEFKVVNSFTLETSQYAYTVGEEVIRFTERDYIRVSQFLMTALDEYRKLLAELHNELINDQAEWLRPCKLRELAGMPAADLLKREIEEEKEEAKKREKRERKERQKSKNSSMIQHSNNQVNTSFINKNTTPRITIKEKSESPTKSVCLPILTQTQNTRKNSKESPSWKDYFSETELYELKEDYEQEKTQNSDPKNQVNPQIATISSDAKLNNNEKTESPENRKIIYQNTPLKISPVTIVERIVNQVQEPKNDIKRRIATLKRQHLIAATPMGRTAAEWNNDIGMKTETEINENNDFIDEINNKKESNKTFGNNSVNNEIMNENSMIQRKKSNHKIRKVDISLTYHTEKRSNYINSINIRNKSKPTRNNTKEPLSQESSKKHQQIIPLSFLSNSIRKTRESTEKTGNNKKLNFQSFFHYHKYEYASKTDKTNNEQIKTKTVKTMPENSYIRQNASTEPPELEKKIIVHGVDPTKKKKPMKEILGMFERDPEKAMEYQYLSYIFSPGKTKSQWYFYKVNNKK